MKKHSVEDRCATGAAVYLSGRTFYRKGSERVNVQSIDV